MKKLTAFGLVAVILLGLAGAGLWLARGAIATAIMARAYDKAMGTDFIAGLPDGLHVGLCGSGSPMPDPTRGGPMHRRRRRAEPVCHRLRAGQHQKPLSDEPAAGAGGRRVPDPFPFRPYRRPGRVDAAALGGRRGDVTAAGLGAHGREPGRRGLRAGLHARRGLPDRTPRGEGRAARRLRRRAPRLRDQQGRTGCDPDR